MPSRKTTIVAVCLRMHSTARLVLMNELTHRQKAEVLVLLSHLRHLSVLCVAFCLFVHAGVATTYAVTLRTGQVLGVPGNAGTHLVLGPDAGAADDAVNAILVGPSRVNRTVVAPEPVKLGPFTPADFAQTGSPAKLIIPHAPPTWLSTLPSDPLARWINHAHDPIPHINIPHIGSGSPSLAVLYRHDFTISVPGNPMGTFAIRWAVDDLLGDVAVPLVRPAYNPMGFYLNGVPLPISGGNSATETSAVLTNVPLLTGVNSLYTYQVDYSSVSGIIYSATITPQPLLLRVLTNFDVVNNTGQEVNDFQVTYGNTAPSDILQGGSGLTLQPWTNAPHAPHFLAGWDPSVTPGPGPGETTVKWGPGSSGNRFLAPGQSLHFGATLLNGHVPSDICMTWTRDNVPIHTGGDPNLPITIIPEPAIYDPNGNLVVQTVNQVCADSAFPPTNRWVQRFVRSVDRELNLQELVIGNPVLDLSTQVDAAPILLAPDQSIDLAMPSLPPSPTGISGAIIWYSVYEDNNGAPGQLVGTSYYGLNFAVEMIPEPSTTTLCIFASAAFGVFRSKRQVLDNAVIDLQTESFGPGKCATFQRC